MDAKPDLDQPVQPTHLNQAVGIVEKKADQEYEASREWKLNAMLGGALGVAGVAVGIAASTSIAPIMAAPMAAIGISVFAAKKIKEDALREVAQEFKAGRTIDVDHDDGSTPDLNNPVQITGMNKAMDVLDKKSQKCMKASKSWMKGAIAGGVLAAGLTMAGVTPAAVLGYTAAMGAVAGYNYIRGKTFAGLKSEFNQNAAPGDAAKAPAARQQGPAPAKPGGGMKI